MHRLQESNHKVDRDKIENENEKKTSMAAATKTATAAVAFNSSKPYRFTNILHSPRRK